ncbi:MAG TPA: sigma-70 family RNA polymerase sigma factor, partial [Gemmataceae bacterium]|nr:sigma-70 family RNA polymerase sigma factor [Gemmataceae bacterium]
MAARTALNVVQLVAKSAGFGQRTDAQLIADFLDHKDPSSFEALVRRHGPLVLSACRQVLRCDADAEDAFQATFVALYQKAAGIRRQPSVAGWLFRVARRTALRARRAAARRARHEAKASPLAKVSPDLSWREACAALHDELDRLPETYRSALVLCYLEGMSRDEAAHQLGWTLNEVRGRLERGRLRLRGRLQKRGITLSAGLLTA